MFGGILLCASLLGAFLDGSEAAAGDAAERRRNLIVDSATRSDTVLRGTVLEAQSYVHKDGGHGYRIAVAETYRGRHLEVASVRAGGWAYLVELAVGEQILIFLKESTSPLVDEQFTVVDVSGAKPLVFRVEGSHLIPVDASLLADFGHFDFAEVGAELGALGKQ